MKLRAVLTPSCRAMKKVRLATIDDEQSDALRPRIGGLGSLDRWVVRGCACVPFWDEFGER